MANRDWTGFIVVIPEQHNLIVSGPWKKERPDMWWWKCRNCNESSGVMSTIELERLEKKGMIMEPDGELAPEDSKHPKEGVSKEDYENFYGMYEWG